MKNVFVYLRVSTLQQVDGDGFGRQLEACENLCRAKGWNILRVGREQQTGSDAYNEREVLNDLLENTGPNTSQTIVVERVDRISRDLIPSEKFFEECRKKGVEVYPADTGEEMVMATADPTRILVRHILGALAQWEKSQIVHKLQAGRRKKKAETGRPCGGKRAFGDNKVPELAARERAAINDIVRFHREGHPFERIARWMNGRHKTPNGGDKWTKATVHRIYQENQQKAFGPNVL